MTVTKTKVSKVEDEEFTWKFRILDISPIFADINSGKFKKIAEPNIYTCAEEYNDLADKYIGEGLIQLYTSEDEPLRTPEKRYAIEDGRFMLYENKGHLENGEMVWKEYGISITDNFYIVIDEDVEFDDGIEKIHRWQGKIIVKDRSQEYPFDVDGRLFANSQDMSKLLIGIAGTQVSFDNNKLKDIRNAAIATSDIILRSVSQVFGWHGSKVYQTQSSMIVQGGVKKMEEGNVDLSDIGHARHLDMVVMEDLEFKSIGEHIVKDLLNMHERYPMDCLFGFTFLAPIASRIINSEGWSGGRVGMWIVGGSGCGKTYTSVLFQNFFGDFKGEKSVFSWLGTPYSIQEGGYHFKDTLYMVDDFKIAHFSQSSLNSVVMVLQNYADGTARTRLGPDMNLKEGKPIRGSLLITGEDLLDDVASVMARYHVVRMDKDYINRDAGRLSYKHRSLYSGFMGRYIAWLMKDTKVISKIVRRIEEKKDRFIGDRTSANIDRISQSFAYNLVGFEMFCRFLEENGFISAKKRIEMVKIHKNDLFLHIDKNVMDVKDATVSEVFINTLTDLINSGAVRIHNVGVDKPTAYGKDEYVGFDDLDEYIYFFGNPVWNAVNNAVGSGKGLTNSKTNLVNELVKRGIMIPHLKKDGTKGGNTCNKLFYGNAVATWRILKSALGYEEEEVTDDDMEGW